MGTQTAADLAKAGKVKMAPITRINHISANWSLRCSGE
jgi:hypothetical protein